MTAGTIMTTACAPGALDGGPVRTRFFDGMFLTQADLETEQRYWRLKRRLTNRALGAGVAWGLRLAWQPKQRIFQLSPGYALDCCGNDLVVECPAQVAWADLWSRADPSLTAAPILGKSDEQFKLRHACVVLQYTECAQDPRTVQGDACQGVTGNCQPSRVRESARLLLVSPPEACESPPEKFDDALSSFLASLPASVLGKLTPPQGSPATSATPNIPAWPAIRLTNQPGGTTPVTSMSFPAPGATTASYPDVTATETLSSDTPTATVTFLVDATPGWGFDTGIVVDDLASSQTVTSVSTSQSPEIAWSVQVTPPSANQLSTPVTQPFTYTMQNLQMSQTASGGSGTAGTYSVTISGMIVLTMIDQATANVAVSKLTMSVTGGGTGTVTNPAPPTNGGLFGGEGCLDRLVPWGWARDPDSGADVGRVLLLAAAYGLLQDYTANDQSAASGVLAQTLYNATWLGLFGVDASANQGVQFAQLGDMLSTLFQHWCCHFAYAGPRCCDEHHGVYLGTCELDLSGNVVSFDPWLSRRYVLTGPVLAHWAGQLGIAPIDVIVGRFVQALCCLGASGRGDKAWAAPPATVSDAGHVDLDRLHVGTAGSVADFAEARGATVRFVGFADLAKSAVQAFSAPTGGAQEVLAMQVRDGGTIGLLVPVSGGSTATASASGTAALTAEITAQMKRAGHAHVVARARPLVARFVTRLLDTAPASSLVDADAPAGTKHLAKQLDAKRTTVADLAIGASAASGPGADDLVDRAELAVEAVTAATVKVVGHAADAATFRDHAKHKALHKALADALPKLTARTLAAAAVHAASGA